MLEGKKADPWEPAECILSVDIRQQIKCREMGASGAYPGVFTSRYKYIIKMFMLLFIIRLNNNVIKQAP